MPPKTKNKKGKQEAFPTGPDYTRRPLVAPEPCDARPSRRRELPVISAHHAFEEWDDDAILETEWGVVGAEPFEDEDGRSYLPARIAARVACWLRPRDLLAQEKDEVVEEDGQQSAAGGGGGRKGGAVGAEKGKPSGGGDKGKPKPSKGKDKAPSFEPVVLEDAVADEAGNPLPRIFVSEAKTPGDGDELAEAPESNQAAEGSAGRNSSITTAILPRGFKAGWTEDQRRQMSSMLPSCKEQQQHQEDRPPEIAGGQPAGAATNVPPEKSVESPLEGDNNVLPPAVGLNAPPSILGAVDVAALGAPGGEDIDHAMTAIFKAVGRLSPTISRSGCPLLWESIHPKTAAEAPCYNPCGRYAVKLFAAGRWRKVEVDDSIPVDAARCPVIAASEDPAELWPILLSKALYKLYRLGGYEIAQEAISTPASHSAVTVVTTVATDATVQNGPAAQDATETCDPVADGVADGINGMAIGGDWDGGRVGEEDDVDECGDQASRARFVAFVVHSLTGWIPSGASCPTSTSTSTSTPFVVSAEMALAQGTPSLTSDDLLLPALPPVDEEEEAARERLEERKRRQALFLHKKRRPRKVERKVISTEERAEVDAARVRKMRAVAAKVLNGHRREVYMVCMPGVPACPVLAVCPAIPSAIQASANSIGNPPSPAQGSTHLIPEQQPRQGSGGASEFVVSAGVGTSTSTSHAQEQQTSSLQPVASLSITSTTTPAGSAAEEEIANTLVTAAAEATREDENLPLGFLLKWEITPAVKLLQVPTVSTSKNGSASTNADAASSSGLAEDQQEQQEPNGVSSSAEEGAPTQEREGENRVLYGGGGRRRGRGRGGGLDRDKGRQSAMDRATGASTSASLSSPAFLWLSPRQIELAGGTVVRALTKVDKTAYADVQYHWKLVIPPEKTDQSNTAGEKVAGKDGKANKAKGKHSEKDGKTSVKGQGTKAANLPGDGVPPPSTGENVDGETDESLSGTAIALGNVVPKGLGGRQARDPGSPPAIFLLVTPSPRSEPKRAVPPGSGNKQQPHEGARGSREEDGEGLDEGPRREEEEEGEERGEIRGGEARAPVARAASEVPAVLPEVAPLATGSGEEDSSEIFLRGRSEPENEAASSEQGDCTGELVEAEGEAENEQKQGEEEGEGKEEGAEEEEAEILMCLWADQAGASAPKRAGGRAMVVLQEVLPGGPHDDNDSVKPVPGGRVIMRTKHNPELSGFPLTATSAKIRLVKGGGPKVFRILLQPSLGCCVGFSCTHDIETGDAGGIWAQAGYSQVTETGKYEGARPGEWKILFRRAFRVATDRPSLPTTPPPPGGDPEETESRGGSAENSGSDTAEEGYPPEKECRTSEDNNGDEAATGIIKMKTNDGTESKPLSEQAVATSSTFVKAILHLPDEESRPSVSLAFVDEDTGLEMIQPALHTNMVPLKPNLKGYSVLAFACSRSKAIPKGAWRLQLLSDRALLPLEPAAHAGRDTADLLSKSSKNLGDGTSANAGVGEDRGEEGGGGATGSATTVVPCQNRGVYGGYYVPNKHLLLFRDVLTCSSPLPFAVRLRGSTSAVPQMRLRLKFLDAVTGKTLRDIRGHHLVQVLAITPPPAPSEDDPSSTPTKEMPAKEKGGAKDKAVATEQAVPAPGKIIVEAALDWEKMKVPPHLVSELPHCFQATPEGLPHSCPPSPTTDASPRNLYPGETTSGICHELANCGEEGSGDGVAGGTRTSSSAGPPATVRTSRSSSLSRTTARAIAPSEAAVPETETGAAGKDLVCDVTGEINPDGTSPPVDRDENTTKELFSWWLEIVGAEEVELAHDTARMDKENREVERWETDRPGRAARAALLWTQRQASKVFSLGNAESPPTSVLPSSAGTAVPETATSATPSPSEDGYEDWIKARAVAIGVPVPLEKERQACRLALSKTPATGVAMPAAPSSGSVSLVAMSQLPSSSALSALFIGDEEMKERAQKRAALRQATADFEKKWEADRVDKVKAGQEEMSMQLRFIRGREEKVKDARLPFLRDRENIVQDLIAKANTRKEVLEAERAALEPTAKGAKSKQAKGKAGKK